MSTISTIIPAHNAERFLREAIESVLAQSVPSELVVVNDGSSDGTAEIMASYGGRIVCVHQQQLGLGAARNAGIERSTGELLAFLDADDIWAADKLLLQSKALKGEGPPDMAFGHCVEFADGEETLGARAEPFPAYSACAMLVRRRVFQEIGLFTTGRAMGEFIDWYSRAAQRGAAPAMLEQVVFYRRVHRDNMTRNAQNRRDEYLSVIRAHLQRTRTDAR